MYETIAVAQTLLYAAELRQLYDRERQERHKAEQALAQLRGSYATTVRALAAALELRDDDTGEHAQRVAALAMRLTRQIDPELAGDPQLEYGFLLHDLGKIGVPDAILLKPGPLTPEELDEMRRHPVLGERILARIPYLNGLARQVVASHHERWDGQGYPRGLAEERIPLAARIFAVADSFDAMTHDRPYRLALSIETALKEIARGSGTQFDPTVAGIFRALGSESLAAA